ncbi:ATPase [Aureococcus anophagefferens]|nr:ATPase [Aureococcus anophagefferens]
MIITARYGDAVVTKRRRFHRVPVPPTAGGYVQVDHARAGLLVDGDPWIGQGWYVAATSNVSWNNSLERLADVIVYENAPKGINQGMPYGLSAHPPKAQLAFLDAVHRVGFKVIYPVVSGNVSINHGGPFDGRTSSRRCGRASIGEEHPALLGYYVCDDCCSNNHDVSLQAQVYAVMKDVDPYHPTIGASDCGNTWMFTDQAPSWLKSEQDDGDRVLPVATQPALQLSLDVVMQENYGARSRARRTGAWAGGVGGDGWFRNGAAFEPVYNCPGPSQAEYGGPVYPGESTASDAWQLAEQQAIFAEHVAYLRPALAAPFGTEHPAVRAFPAEIRARAWAVPDRGALNCSTILAVVNTNETRATTSGYQKTSACLACTHQLRGDVDVDAYLARHDRFHALPLKADDHAADMKLLADPREALRDQLAALAFQPLFTDDSLGRCGPAIAACPAWSGDGSLKQLRRYTLARLYGVDARFRANSDYVAFSLHRLAAYGCAKARGIVAGLPRPVVHFPEAAERFAAAGLVEVRLHEAILGGPGPGAATRRQRRRRASRRRARAAGPGGRGAGDVAGDRRGDGGGPRATLVYDFRPGDLVMSCISFNEVKRGDLGTVLMRPVKDKDVGYRVDINFDGKKFQFSPGHQCHRLDVFPNSGRASATRSS